MSPGLMDRLKNVQQTQEHKHVRVEKIALLSTERTEAHALVQSLESQRSEALTALAEIANMKSQGGEIDADTSREIALIQSEAEQIIAEYELAKTKLAELDAQLQALEGVSTAELTEERVPEQPAATRSLDPSRYDIIQDEPAQSEEVPQASSGPEATDALEQSPSLVTPAAEVTTIRNTEADAARNENAEVQPERLGPKELIGVELVTRMIDKMERVKTEEFSKRGVKDAADVASIAAALSLLEQIEKGGRIGSSDSHPVLGSLDQSGILQLQDWGKKIDEIVLRFKSIAEDPKNSQNLSISDDYRKALRAQNLLKRVTENAIRLADLRDPEIMRSQIETMLSGERIDFESIINTLDILTDDYPDMRQAFVSDLGPKLLKEMQQRSMSQEGFGTFGTREYQALGKGASIGPSILSHLEKIDPRIAAEFHQHIFDTSVKALEKLQPKETRETLFTDRVIRESVSALYQRLAQGEDLSEDLEASLARVLVILDRNDKQASTENKDGSRTSLYTPEFILGRTLINEFGKELGAKKIKEVESKLVSIRNKYRSQA